MTEDQALVVRAKDFAARAHAGQKRNYTHEPYTVHLAEVAGLVAKAGLGYHAEAVAWLHDTVEDTDATADMIAHEFGGPIAIDVIALTNYSKFFGSREQRHFMDCHRIRGASSRAKSVKCADLISNTTSIVEHDKDFAVRYLDEKELLLQTMQTAFYDPADATLLKRAWDTLWAAQRQLAEHLRAGA